MRRGEGKGGGEERGGVGGKRKQQENLFKNDKRISQHSIFFSLHGGRSFVFDLCRSCFFIRKCFIRNRG